MSLLAAAGPGLGAAASRPSIDDFLAEPALAEPALSPSGRYLAYAENRGGVSRLMVLDLDEVRPTELSRTAESDEVSYDWLHWKSDDRLLVGASIQKERPHGGRAEWGFIKTEDRRGTFAFDRATGASIVLGYPNVVDYLDKNPEHILMSGYTRSGAVLWRVNVTTGEGEVVERGPYEVSEWIVDGDGAIMGRWERATRGWGWSALMARNPDGKGYTEVIKLRPQDHRKLEEIEFLGPTPEPWKVYARITPKSSAEAATSGVHLYDFRTREAGPAIWSHPTYDAEEIVVSRHTKALLAGCYVAEVYRCDYTDPVAAATFKALSAYFQDQRNIREVSRSDNGERSVLLVSGPEDPGSYYVYYWKDREIEPLGPAHPRLPAEALGRMERVSWKARDGTKISGYLTLPPGGGARDVPLVVMPHGGPEQRDRYDFDLWGQFLATRGYAVFQPNFRGSGGFGRAFAEAGYGEWGGLMQTDVEDGVQHLIDSGRVDPDRMCIFGGSYGGYVALYAGASQPWRYKCVASFAGVSDLAPSVEQEDTWSGTNSAAYDYWLRSIGDPRHNRARLDARSPVRLASRFVAPVLLVHGAQDSIVPVAHSRRMADALKREGREVELIVLADEGHGGWRDVNQKRALLALEAFLEKHLKGAARAAP